MIADEIRAMWVRWSHRSDIAADLPTIEALAKARIRDRMMSYANIFEPLEGETEADAMARAIADAPALWCAAGLMEVFRLAADEAQMTREATVFEGAAVDYILRVSQERGPAHAARSYPDDGN